MAPYRGVTGGIDPTKQTHTVSSLAAYMVYTVTGWHKGLTSEDFVQRCTEWRAVCAITFLKTAAHKYLHWMFKGFCFAALEGAASDS